LEHRHVGGASRPGGDCLQDTMAEAARQEALLAAGAERELAALII
jgi:hypothetical protein